MRVRQLGPAHRLHDSLREFGLKIVLTTGYCYTESSVDESCPPDRAGPLVGRDGVGRDRTCCRSLSVLSAVSVPVLGYRGNHRDRGD